MDIVLVYLLSGCQVSHTIFGGLIFKQESAGVGL